jgi:hypothetical protein
MQLIFREQVRRDVLGSYCYRECIGIGVEIYGKHRGFENKSTKSSPLKD